MPYIDNSRLFNSLPQRTNYPKNIKYTIAGLSVGFLTVAIWGALRQKKVSELKKEKQQLLSDRKPILPNENVQSPEEIGSVPSD
jgi:hypothetical protein